MHGHTLFQSAVKGSLPKKIPFWLMRQAGRYLPEYQATRKEAGGFLKLALTPKLATEVTLQPIRRFDMDAAIIFSDILIPPYALGMDLRYEEGEGPKMTPLTSGAEIKNLDLNGYRAKLEPVYEALSEARRLLPKDKSLIGFAGAPFTVALYMLEGGGSNDYSRAKQFMFTQKREMDELIQILISVTTDYLYHQVKAGADVVKLFDSWAGLLPEPYYSEWVIRPARHIVRNLRSHYPDLPIICFPRGSGASYKKFARDVMPSMIAIDQTVDPLWAKAELQPICTVQGNLDPLLLVAGGEEMEKNIAFILQSLEKGPFVFNLGHGVLKYTKPEHVLKLSEQIKAFSRG